jgi:rubrerythrin
MTPRHMTREKFLIRGAVAAGSLYIAAPALAHQKHGAFGGGDVGIVNFVLTFEKVEAEFLKAALETEGLGADAKKLLESIAANDAEHVKSLNQSITQLGGKADPAPKANAQPPANEEAALRSVADLKDAAVSSYNGAATQIQSADVLQAIASIVQVEARHAAGLRTLAQDFVTKTPFDEVFSSVKADEAVHQRTL